MYNLDNVSVSYKDTLALKEISLTINEGEKIAFIGPSGAGKTTLLNTLYDQNKDSSAFVHQHYALVPQLSVFHNVYAGRLDYQSTLYNLLTLIKPQKDDLARIEPILESLGMRDYIFKRVGALSGGQQQRTAIARAMYRKGDILFADEPISSIDPHQAGTVLKLIIDTTKTVVMSLHSVHLALEYAHRIIGLRLGRVFFDLPTDKVNERLLSELYQSC